MTDYGVHCTCPQFAHLIWDNDLPESRQEELWEHLEKCETTPRFSFRDEAQAPSGVVGKEVDDGTSFYNIYHLQDALDK